MILNRNFNPFYLFLVLLSLGIPCGVQGQNSGDFETYSKNYPNNAVILTSLKQEMVIRMTNGKPVLNISEYKAYLALNENANYFANSKETFGSIYKFNSIEAYSLVPGKDEYRKIPVTSFNKTYETTNSFFYDDVTSYNFTFPSVVKGTQMISKTKISSDDPTFSYKFYFGNFFPGDEYVFTVICPENVEIKYRIFGKDTSIINFSEVSKGGKKVYTWRASNPKSYIRDDYAPDADYYIPHIIVQVSEYEYKGKTTRVNNSLDDLYKTLYKRVSNINLSPSGEIKSLTDSLTKGEKSNREKVRIIYRWIQNNIKYIAFEDGENGFVPREAILVLKRKYGDCKDKTSLLVEMMRSQGLNASYTWIGTRDIPYKFSDFANGSNINHMVATWWDDDNKPVILDGTSRYHTLEDIPAFIQGKECLIENGPDKCTVFTIPIALPEKNTIYDSLSVELKGDTLVGNGMSIINGELRSLMLDCFEGKDITDLPEIVNEILPKISNKFIIESVNTRPKDDVETTLEYDYKFYLPDYLTINHNVAYLNLNLDRFPVGITLDDDRWIPFELDNTKKHIFVCTFKIPDGYEVKDIPKNSSFDNKLFSYHISYMICKNEIIVRTVVTLNFQVIEDEELVQFREMLTQLNSNYIKSIPIYKTDKQ